jgi:cupin 2 domain-containing protein
VNDGGVPEGFALVRTIGPFSAETLPKGLLAEHRLKPDRWGHLTLRKGAVRLVLGDGSGTTTALQAPAGAMIPPEVPHHLEFDGDFLLEITFLTPLRG